MNATFAQWLNANSTRSYPLRENATKTDTTGTFTIPDDFLVAAQINFPRSYANGSFFISRISAYAESTVVSISHIEDESEASVVCSILITHADHTKGKYYAFSGEGEHYSILGSICVGSLESIKTLGVGSFDFLPVTTPFEPNCLMVSIPAMKSVEIYDGGSMVYVADDVLRLRAGENIRLSYVEDSGKKVIRIDAISGENVVKPEECDNASGRILGPIRTINNIGPDENDNFNLFASDCIELVPGDNGITIKDKCSQSCCGCDEFDDLVAGLEAIRAQEAQLRNAISVIQSTQADMIAKMAAQIV